MEINVKNANVLVGLESLFIATRLITCIWNKRTTTNTEGWNSTINLYVGAEKMFAQK